MNITATPLDGLLIIQPNIFKDDRGHFFETHQQIKYKSLGLPEFVQDNISYSKKNVIRGLHYQLPFTQGKLVWALKGSVWDIAVDLRKNSKTFGQWFSINLNDENHTQLYVPHGFAHGFCVLSDEAQFYYKCSDYYHPASEQGILWNDPQLNIPWPIEHPVLSPKDKLLPTLNEIPNEQLF